MLAVLVNGEAPVDPAHAIGANDRAFNYGDGVFETALLRNRRVRFLDDHLERLRSGCERLGIDAPARSALLADIEQLVAMAEQGVIKIVVSRGAGRRGYRPTDGLATTRVTSLYPPPGEPEPGGIAVRWCATRLARNARLAGIKHLNRLEQVLAQSEWHDERIAEGLMLDTEGELVGGTASNVFLIRDGALVTPDLRFCGVRGVMRAQVLRAAKRIGIAVSEEPLWPHEVQGASEFFLTNAVRGIRPVAKLDSLQWGPGAIARNLCRELQS